jgi:phosphoribulokinase
MKFLKMYSKMENHQMVGGIEHPYVDIEYIRHYSIERDVRNREHNKYVGISIVCESPDHVHYAAPPLDYTDLINDVHYANAISGDKKVSKEKTELYNTHMKNIESFIPFMLKAFKLAEDGTILQIAVKNEEWELEEVD